MRRRIRTLSRPDDFSRPPRLLLVFPAVTELSFCLGSKPREFFMLRCFAADHSLDECAVLLC